MTGILRPLTFVMCATLGVAPSHGIVPSEHNDFRSWTFDWASKEVDIFDWLRARESDLKHGDGCQLYVHWSEPEKQFHSALHNVILLVLAPEEGEATFLVEEAMPGVSPRVGVRYFSYEDKLSRLDMALAFEGPAQKVFSEATRAEASVVRERGWTAVSVTKPVQVGSRFYTFDLQCEKGQTFMRFLRDVKKKR